LMDTLRLTVFKRLSVAVIVHATAFVGNGVGGVDPTGVGVSPSCAVVSNLNVNAPEVNVPVVGKTGESKFAAGQVSDEIVIVVASVNGSVTVMFAA
jgi:hypothetical protein